MASCLCLSGECFDRGLRAGGQLLCGGDCRPLGRYLDRVSNEYADRIARGELARGDQPYRDEWDAVRECEPGGAAGPAGGCTGTPVNDTLHCDCNPGFYWDAKMSQCQAGQADKANKPPGPFVCSTTGLVCNMP